MPVEDRYARRGCRARDEPQAQALVFDPNCEFVSLCVEQARFPEQTSMETTSSNNRTAVGVAFRTLKGARR